MDGQTNTHFINDSQGSLLLTGLVLFIREEDQIVPWAEVGQEYHHQVPVWSDVVLHGHNKVSGQWEQRYMYMYIILDECYNIRGQAWASWKCWWTHTHTHTHTHTVTDWVSDDWLHQKKILVQTCSDYPSNTTLQRLSYRHTIAHGTVVDYLAPVSYVHLFALLFQKGIFSFPPPSSFVGIHVRCCRSFLFSNKSQALAHKKRLLNPRCIVLTDCHKLKFEALYNVV